MRGEPAEHVGVATEEFRGTGPDGVGVAAVLSQSREEPQELVADVRGRRELRQDLVDEGHAVGDLFPRIRRPGC